MNGLRVTAIVAAAALLLGGCTRHVVRVDAARFAASPARASIALHCGYHLRSVVDARANGDSAGALTANTFRFPDAPEVMRTRLLAAGLHAEPAAGDRAVDVQLLQLYVNGRNVSKVPVAVLRVAVDGGPPQLVRSQMASSNWAGSQDEAYGALASAIDDAQRQVVEHLQSQCPAST